MLVLKLIEKLVMSLLFLCVSVSYASAIDATVNDALILAEKPAKKLSDYGFFNDAGGRSPNARVLPYDLNNPLFTDYALKFRYVYVPNDVSPAPYQEATALNFPVGSALIKTFAYPADLAKQEENIRFVETRLLVHKKDGWKAYPYVWNEEQTEAYLKVAGKRLEISVTMKNGEEKLIQYAVPNINQCKGCHVNAKKKFTPIGPKIRNLNKDFHYEQVGTVNQLEHLRSVGYIGGGPERASEMPRVPNPFDASDGDLNSRARSYLDANCAHCHARGRPADTSGLYLNYLEEKEVQWGVNKPPVAAGGGSGGLDVDIKTGAPDQSILIYRMKSLNPGAMMPELGRSVVDEEGVALIEEFIRNLD